MKIIFSRKGFDSGSGGCASPIFPDGRMVSLPIPGGPPARYADVQGPGGSLGPLVRDLSGRLIRPYLFAHLDPDLTPSSLVPRLDGWRPSLGQTGAAQSHLAAQGVGVGDVFLFFGWFKDVQQRPDGRWEFVPKAVDRHVLFGYLRVGDIVPLGACPDREVVVGHHPWMENHPHLWGSRHANNTVYAADPMGWKIGNTVVPGGEVFGRYHPDLTLTAPDASSRSVWRMPSWSVPSTGRTLSYHGDAGRWGKGDDGEPRLRAVAKGQEFVIDVGDDEDARSWVERLVVRHDGHAA